MPFLRMDTFLLLTKQNAFQADGVRPTENDGRCEACIYMDKICRLVRRLRPTECRLTCKIGSYADQETRLSLGNGLPAACLKL